jgi:hypothetical protein
MCLALWNSAKKMSVQKINPVPTPQLLKKLTEL